MKTIFIEDDRDLQKLLSGFMTTIAPDLEIIAITATVNEAIMLIERHEPELIILDLNLNQQSGFDVLRYFPQRTFQVIIMTGHAHLADKAAAFGVNGFITKPVERPDFASVIERVREHIKIRRIAVEYQQQNPNWLQKRQDHIIYRKLNGIEQKVCPSDIRYIKADKSWSEIHCHTDGVLPSNKQISDWEQELCACGASTMVRVHKSYLLNHTFVQSWQPSGKDAIVTLTTGERIPVSRTYKQQFLEKFYTANGTPQKSLGRFVQKSDGSSE